jgi:hypothetical protein
MADEWGYQIENDDIGWGNSDPQSMRPDFFENRLKESDGSNYYPTDSAGNIQETWYGGKDYDVKEWPSGPSTGGTSYSDLPGWGATAGAAKASGATPTKSTSSKVGGSAATAAAIKASQLHPLKVGSSAMSTTKNIAPAGPTPEYGEIPDFVAPEWNEREINRMTQQKAAPGVRKLRTAIQQAQSRTYENPNVGRMTLRDALAGYGLGLEGVMAGAGSQALSEYGRKYQTQYEGGMAKYSADRAAQASMFNAAWNNYLKQYTTKTTQTENYDYDVLNLTPELGFTKTNLGKLASTNPTAVTFGTGY